MRNCRTLSRWSPCSMIWPFLEVPPQAQKVFSFWAKSARFELCSSIPSTMVLALPNFLVSNLMRIRCCSFSISPQTHKSFGSPQVEQTSAMTLKHSIVIGIYKSFKAEIQIWLGMEKRIGDFLCFAEDCSDMRFFVYTPSINTELHGILQRCFLNVFGRFLRQYG
jgi:hypothetical protein